MSLLPLQVVVVQENGNDCDVDSINVLNIGRLRMKLSRGKAVVAKEFYSSSMQVLSSLLNTKSLWSSVL